MNEDDRNKHKLLKTKVILWLKRIFIIAGNSYSWFWLVREIFFRHSTNIEEYLLWFFLTIGFYWFTLDHQEIFIKDKSKK